MKFDMGVQNYIFACCRTEFCRRKLETCARLDSAYLLVFRDENFCDKSLKAVLEKAVLNGFATL